MTERTRDSVGSNRPRAYSQYTLPSAIHLLRRACVVGRCELAILCEQRRVGEPSASLDDSKDRLRQYVYRRRWQVSITSPASAAAAASCCSVALAMLRFGG